MQDTGEFGVISRITAGRRQPDSTLLGPGDDAALVAVSGGVVVASVDMLIEGRHFRIDWSTPHDIGRKAVAQNAADLVAMGANPLTFLVALGCPPNTGIAFTDALNEGLWEEAACVGAGISGGDLVQAPGVTLSVTALGDLHGRRAVLRSGARPGDLVAVAGATGYSVAGYTLLSRGIAARTAAAAECLSVHRSPRPPYSAGLAAADLATAMIDTSDGLVSDLGHIAAASGVRISIDSRALGCPKPVREVAALCGASAVDWVLDGGEDHAFAGTFPPGAQLPVGWRPIGNVNGAADTGPGVVVDGKPRRPGGWTSWTVP